MSKDIWVYAETNNGKLCDIVPELLNKGQNSSRFTATVISSPSFSALPMSRRSAH